MDENEAAIRERLTAVESSVKSAHHRIDNIEELTQSVKSLAVETKYLKEDISDIKEKIDVIAGRPSQILTVIITALITATISGFVGFAITNLLK
jgi:hypothetical protein